jgi:hypothetical protein
MEFTSLQAILRLLVLVTNAKHVHRNRGATSTTNLWCLPCNIWELLCETRIGGHTRHTCTHLEFDSLRDDDDIASRNDRTWLSKHKLLKILHYAIKDCVGDWEVEEGLVTAGDDESYDMCTTHTANNTKTSS